MFPGARFRFDPDRVAEASTTVVLSMTWMLKRDCWCYTGLNDTHKDDYDGRAELPRMIESVEQESLGEDDRVEPSMTTRPGPRVADGCVARASEGLIASTFGGQDLLDRESILKDVA
jgi:hypothetical protein